MSYGSDVIIIDDDPAVIELLEMYCENLGYFRNIIKAKDGSEASKKLFNQQFCVILLDVNMPRKTGVDIIRELSHKDHINNTQSVIIISGELSKAILTHAMSKGAKNFLVKPFTEEQFKQKVESVIKTTSPDLLT